jgi:sec1 family domain-containing protein 1
LRKCYLKYTTAFKNVNVQLHTDREQIQDAPAVYFVRPTEENVKRIADDCSKQLYRNFYLHFVTRVERPILEKLAQEISSSSTASLISKVFDQYLDVIALEPSMFTLNIKDSLIAYNDPSISEAQIR